MPPSVTSPDSDQAGHAIDTAVRIQTAAMVQNQTAGLAYWVLPGVNNALLQLYPATSRYFSTRCYKNYTSIDPKQQQSMLQRNSCVIKISLVGRPWQNETQKRRETSTRTPAGTRKIGKSWWNRTPFRAKEEKSRETRPGTLAGTRRNQEIMMENNSFPGKRKGRQVPEPRKL